MQVQGLRETSAFLHDLLSQEIEIVQAEDVVLIGLSQGCAASIIATLLWEGEAFGALVGMCGYLPFRKGMHDCIEDAVTEENDPVVGLEDDGGDIFERDSVYSEAETESERAVKWLREEPQIHKERGNYSKPCLYSQYLLSWAMERKTTRFHVGLATRPQTF